MINNRFQTSSLKSSEKAGWTPLFFPLFKSLKPELANGRLYELALLRVLTSPGRGLGVSIPLTRRRSAQNVFFLVPQLHTSPRQAQGLGVRTGSVAVSGSIFNRSQESVIGGYTAGNPFDALIVVV